MLGWSRTAVFSSSAVQFACNGGTLIPRQTTESTLTEAEVLGGVLAAGVESTADLDETADLQEESATDPTRVPTEEPSRVAESGPQTGEAKVRGDSEGNGESRASKAGLIATDDLLLAPIPRLRMMGFFAFATCALIALFFGAQRHSESSQSKADVVLKARSPRGEVLPLPDRSWDHARGF
jgi:hypothetical protein